MPITLNLSQTGSGLVHGYLVPTGQPDEYTVHLEAEAAYGRHFVSWTGLSAPWNGAVISTGPTTETNVTNPPAVLSVHALFDVDAADLDIRQDFDDLWASWNLSHIRWYKYDRNQSAILNKPNGIPDGFELYLMEYMLKHPEALPEEIEYSEILEGWLENQARWHSRYGQGALRAGSARWPTPHVMNSLAAYMLVGDYGSNMHARFLSAYPSLYGNPGVPIHTFKHLPQHLALDADPDGDGYTNLQEWQYIKLYEANPDALAILYAQVVLDPVSHPTGTATGSIRGGGTVTIYSPEGGLGYLVSRVTFGEFTEGFLSDAGVILEPRNDEHRLTVQAPDLNNVGPCDITIYLADAPEAPAVTLEGAYVYEDDDPYHSADLNRDWIITPEEYARVLQFSAANDLHADLNTVDNYASGAGRKDALRHSADYETPYWQISQAETMQLWQMMLLAAGAYRPSSDPPGGFEADLPEQDPLPGTEGEGEGKHHLQPVARVKANVMLIQSLRRKSSPIIGTREDVKGFPELIPHPCLAA